MSKNFTIDTFFKNQLSDMEVDNADAMWERMEQKLAQQKEKQDRKRYLLFLLLLVPVAAGLMMTAGKKDKEASGLVVFPAKFKNENINKYTAATLDAEKKSDNTNSDNNHMPGLTVSYCPTEPGWYKKGVFVKTDGNNINRLNTHGAATIQFAPGDAGNETADTENSYAIQPDKSAAERKNVAEPATIQSVLVKGEKIPVIIKNQQATAAENKTRSKIQLSVTAGTDLTGKLQNNGKYAMLLLHVPLNRSSSLEFGAGISSHSTSQSYIVSEKQATLNREIDAKLRGLTMLQFPVLYRQKIASTKFQAKAGVTPVYITNAAVTNVPNSFTGVVIPYRTFSLDDINRLNVLFTAGLQYNITPAIGIEVRGNYGLTELVRNSYLNQSNENNNFKAIQLGLAWSLGKKR